jgi:hypothetical protein
MSARAFVKVVLVAAIASLCAPALRADVVTFEYVFEFSGADAPTGPAPWLTATFDDGNTPGSVTLTLSASGLTGTEFVRGWYFNLDPSLNPTSLAFNKVSSSGSFASPAISTGVDAFKADGDGRYDIRFRFATDGGCSTRFGPGDVLTLEITGISTLTAHSFEFLSLPDGGNGPFVSAAHIQGIGPDGEGSGWIAVPEPSSMALAVVGLGAAAVAGVRRRRKSA